MHARVRTEAGIRPRLGFLGVGWIGSHRLNAIAQARCADIACIADTDAECVRRAADTLNGTLADAGPVQATTDFDTLLDADLDGVVIATPNRAHAWQATQALRSGLAVYCQKPLGTTTRQTAAVVAAARSANRLLGVDFCYRMIDGVDRLRELVQGGELGSVYAIDLVFHNAYGPDKPWFYELSQSGGGCVMDLGIHLIDLLVWVLGQPVEVMSSRLYAGGRRLPQPTSELEDFACAELETAGGATARLACSWRLSAGRDAVIQADFYGTRGAVSLRNVNGSFHDFTIECHQGTRNHVLARPSPDWGGTAIRAWVRQLAADRTFDPDAEALVQVSRLVDRIYGR